MAQPLAFPTKGINSSDAFADQAPGTTIDGTNVRAFETLAERGRGGSRPGLMKFVPEKLPQTTPISAAPTDHLIQMLGIIVVLSTETLIGAPDYPYDEAIDDPSSPGPSTSWGTGIIFDDPTLGPLTGVTERSRNPGGPGSVRKVKPRRVRNGGNAKPPNKNSTRTRQPDILEYAQLDPTPRYKFIGFAEYSYSYNLGAGEQHTSATFSGVGCYVVRPGVFLGPPSSAADLPDIAAQATAYFARIAYQNPTGISLVRAWYAGYDSQNLPLPAGVCSCAEIHQYGGYDGLPGNSVPCP